MTVSRRAPGSPTQDRLPLVDLLLSLGQERCALILQPPEELERRLVRSYRNGWILLGALGVACLTLTVLALHNPLSFLPLVLPVAAVLLLGWHGWVYGARPNEQPLATVPAELLGNYTREAIAELVRSASSQFPPGEQPAVFVRESRLANAGASNSWLFDHLPRHNAIFLHSHLLHAFDRDELRAIILHELAHFHRHMQPASRNVGFVMLSRIPLFAGLLSAPFSPAWPLHLLLGGFAYLCQSRALRQSSALSEMLELACDARAASLGGALPAINALLKIAERDQLAGSVLEEMANALSRRSSSEVLAAYRAFLAALPHEPIAPDQALAQFRRLLGESPPRTAAEAHETIRAQGLREIIGRERDRMRASKLVPWRDFDVRLHDRKLDAVELDAYVAELLLAKASPDAKRARRSSHPLVKERILYLYVHFVRPERFAAGGVVTAERHAG